MINLPGSGDEAFDLAVLPNGHVLVAGAADLERGGGTNFAAVELKPNGERNHEFGHDGFAFVDFGGQDTASAVAVQSDGSIVLAGDSISHGNHEDFAIARLTPQGLPDPKFGSDGHVVTDFSDETDAGLALPCSPTAKPWSRACARSIYPHTRAWPGTSRTGHWTARSALGARCSPT